VNRSDQETAERRGPTRAVEPFKKKKKKSVELVQLPLKTLSIVTHIRDYINELLILMKLKE
jgi:hypothetical protein